MKKVFSVLLAGVLAVGLTGCTSTGLETSSTTADNKTADAGSVEKKEIISVYWIGKTLNNP
ncbi:MAG: sugar ABC transporter substrate-binding protein, partial [Lacrimispora sp.]